VVGRAGEVRENARLNIDAVDLETFPSLCLYFALVSPSMFLLPCLRYFTCELSSLIAGERVGRLVGVHDVAGSGGHGGPTA